MTHQRQQRNTKQRKVILEELRKVSSHPTAVEVHEMARRRLPKISLGTVYRNLELLDRAGIIRKLDLGGAETRFDGDPHHHYHVRCICCGRVDDVHGLPESLLREEPEQAHGYRILGHRLEFVGVCPDCSSKPPPEDGLPTTTTEG